MPLGLLRLNEKKQRPNQNINFIKVDDRQSEHDQAIAHDFLCRIAAQCYPVMKEKTLSVMSLEEYPPNPEFLGRNFNAGECIQLVLKDKSGRWLGFKFVQMVMMHELAHCQQMNHSRAFWNVRNEYARTMEGLWAKGYEGEGLWGRGKDLTTGTFVHDRMPENAQIPEHLCGGTYRRRGRKRKRGQRDAEKPRLTYAERQQKRIARKFGKHGAGEALGEDELVRGALERQSGKRQTGKPRVAGSKRGRELRAHAALARFEAAKAVKARDGTPSLSHDDSETESEWSEVESIDGDTAGGVKDGNGNDLYKVCGDEGEDEDGRRDEMEELRMLSGKTKSLPTKPAKNPAAASDMAKNQHDSWPTAAEDGSESEAGSADDLAAVAGPRGTAASAKPPEPEEPPAAHPATPPVAESRASLHAPAPNLHCCPICSLENSLSAPTCMACSHVLKLQLVQGHWRCASEACAGTQYINAGDAGRCGLCGGPRPAADEPGDGAAGIGGGGGRLVGLIGNDVLRWD